MQESAETNQLLELFSNTFLNTLIATSLSLVGIETAASEKIQDTEEIYRRILDP